MNNDQQDKQQMDDCLICGYKIKVWDQVDQMEIGLDCDHKFHYFCLLEVMKVYGFGCIKCGQSELECFECEDKIKLWDEIKKTDQNVFHAECYNQMIDRRQKLRRNCEICNKQVNQSEVQGSRIFHIECYSEIFNKENA